MHKTTPSDQQDFRAERREAPVDASVDLAPAISPALGNDTLRRTLRNPRTLLPNQVLQLQRAVGNRETVRLLGQVPGRVETPIIQPKLKVGPAQDRYEQEAEQVAQDVSHDASHALARAPTTTRLSEGAPPIRNVNAPRTVIQPLFGKKKKYVKPEDNQFLEKTGGVSEGSHPFLILKLMVKTPGYYRSGGSAGHAWIELHLAPGVSSLGALRDSGPEGEAIYKSMGLKTRQSLEQTGMTSIGFYPTGILEPEQFEGEQRGEKSYVMSDATKTVDMFKYIESIRGRTLSARTEEEQEKTSGYSLQWYNCTTFAIKALHKAGFREPGNVKKYMLTHAPALLYKQLFKAKSLGDRSTKVTELSKKYNSQGKKYDFAHLKPGQQRRLNQKLKRWGKKGKLPGPPEQTGIAPTRGPQGHLVCELMFKSSTLNVWDNREDAERNNSQTATRLATNTTVYVPLNEANLATLRAVKRVRGRSIVPSDERNPIKIVLQIVTEHGPGWTDDHLRILRHVDETTDSQTPSAGHEDDLMLDLGGDTEGFSLLDDYAQPENMTLDLGGNHDGFKMLDDYAQPENMMLDLGGNRDGFTMIDG